MLTPYRPPTARRMPVPVSKPVNKDCQIFCYRNGNPNLLLYAKASDIESLIELVDGQFGSSVQLYLNCFPGRVEVIVGDRN